jgi:NAD(P)-dependent dehydrogenase (short-subunit alcohol dehydrogenase family)
MVTVQYAKAFPGIKINAVDPGYTATDLNGGTGTQTVDEGAEIIVRMAQTVHVADHQRPVRLTKVRHTN